MNYNYALFCLLTLTSLTTAASGMPMGRCSIFFHELEKLKAENPVLTSIGPVTLRAASAIYQQTGVIVMSPSIWYNLLYRRTEWIKEASQEGTPFNLLTTAWLEHKRNPSDENLAHLIGHLKQKKELFHPLLLWLLPLTNDMWLYAHAPDASMIVLVPRSYYEKRHDLGLSVAQWQHYALPTSQSEAHSLLRKVMHLCKRSTFTPRTFCSLFSSQKQEPVTPWALYVCGHGRYEPTQIKKEEFSPTGHETCGLTFSTFQEILERLNKRIAIEFFYYQSCFSGGQHLFQLYHYNAVARTSLCTALDLSFPVAAGSLSETPAMTELPTYKENSVTKQVDIVIPIDVSRFFAELENDRASLEDILLPVSPPLFLRSDVHGVSTTPLVIFPHGSECIPVDVTRATTHTQQTKASAAYARLFALTNDVLKKHEQNQSPMVINKHRAVLITPRTITAPLLIHPYYTWPQTKERRFPALVSLIPGNATHHIAALTAYDTPLADFLLDGFCRLTKQHATKTYFIDSLTLDNDIQMHLEKDTDGALSSLLDAVQTIFQSSDHTPASTKRITLTGVGIHFTPLYIECVFACPSDSDEQLYFAMKYKLVHSKSNELVRSQSLQLPLKQVSRKQYDKRIKKMITAR